MHPCEDDIVCKCTTEENKVPYFNAPVYLENKEQIGKVDEIFGQLRDFVSLVSKKRGFTKVFFFLYFLSSASNSRRNLNQPCSIFQSNLVKI